MYHGICNIYENRYTEVDVVDFYSADSKTSIITGKKM